MITLKDFLEDERTRVSSLNSLVEISEKVEGSNIYMKVGKDGEHCLFRDSKCKNVLNPEIEVYFVKPCKYLMSIDNVVLREFEDSVISLWYTGDVGYITKTKEVKNNLVVRNINNNNTIKDDFATIKHIAEVLDVDVVEPVFSGYFTEYQKNEIMRYVNSLNKHTDADFQNFILSLIGLSNNKSRMFKFGEQTAGYVFKFTNSEKANSDRCLVVSPFYDRMEAYKNRFDQTSYISNNLIIISYIMYVSANIDTIKKKIEDGELKSKKDIMKYALCSFIKSNKSQLRNFVVTYNKTLNIENPDTIVKLDDTTESIVKEYNIDKKIVNLLSTLIYKEIKHQGSLITQDVYDMQKNIIDEIEKISDFKEKEEKVDAYEEKVKDKIKKVKELKDKLEDGIDKVKEKKKEFDKEKDELKKKEKEAKEKEDENEPDDKNKKDSKKKKKGGESESESENDKEKEDDDKDKKKNESTEFMNFDDFMKYRLFESI